MSNDLRIRKKIQATRLFSDTQKIELLVKLAEASQEDKKKLEEGIDVFDATYGKAVEKHAQQVRSIIGHLRTELSPDERAQQEEVLDAIDLGFDILSA